MNTVEEIVTSDTYNMRPALQKNDGAAKKLIWITSITVFVAVTFLSQIKLNVNLGFDPHLFAKINACEHLLVFT